MLAIRHVLGQSRISIDFVLVVFHTRIRLFVLKYLPNWVYYTKSKPAFTDICTGIVQSFYSLNFGEKGTLNRASLIIGRGRPLNYIIITSRLIHHSDFTSTTSTATTAKSNFRITYSRTTVCAFAHCCRMP